MTLQTLYNQLHGDYDCALNRLMTDNLVEKFVLKYPNDPSFAQLAEAVAADDSINAFHAVHTLKGVAGNLSFTQLAVAASELTEQLRDGTQAVDAILYNNVKSAHQLVIDTIAAYQAEKA